MAFIAARIRSCAVARRARPAESAVPTAPIQYPLGRSGTRPRHADKSASAPASTLSFAITLNPATTVNHPSVPLATTLWVRLLADSVRIPSTECRLVGVLAARQLPGPCPQL